MIKQCAAYLHPICPLCGKELKESFHNNMETQYSCHAINNTHNGQPHYAYFPDVERIYLSDDIFLGLDEDRYKLWIYDGGVHSWDVWKFICYLPTSIMDNPKAAIERIKKLIIFS